MDFYRIELSKNASKNLKSLDNSVRQRVMKFFEKLEKTENPKSFGEALEENLSGYWKYRVGNYRIVVDIQDDQLVVLIIAIGHRSIIYKEIDKKLK